MNVNQTIWDQFYKTKKILKYPDENFVRIFTPLNLPKESSILDFGCGTGRHIQFFLNEGFCNLYGIDFSYEAIEICKQLYPKVFFSTINEISIQFPMHFFDLILCWGVLHYNDKQNRMALLKEFQRVLKPNSYLIGTYRSKEDTHFTNSQIKTAQFFVFNLEEIHQELSNFFINIQIGHTTRTPLNQLQQKIAHYFFICQTP